MICCTIGQITIFCPISRVYLIYIYGLNQMIFEPTRITLKSCTLIDLSVYNQFSRKKMLTSGVVHLGISDHSLVFMTIKIRYERVGTHRTIESRDYKNIDSDKFLNNLVHAMGFNFLRAKSDCYVGCVENPVHGNCAT